MTLRSILSTRATLPALTVLTLLLCFPGARASTEWSRESVTDGITLYTRDASDTPIKEVKAVMTVDNTLSGITKLIMDTDATKEWVFGIEQSELLKSNGGGEAWVHLVMGLPWPLDNRDAINEMKVSQDETTRHVTIEMISHPDAVAPVDGVIRMAIAQGYWTLSPMADGKVEVAQVYKADPGGKVPEWVINMFVLEGPIATFKAMREKLQQPAYQNATLDFVRD